VVLQGITKRFGHLTALHNVDLEIGEGRALAVFGPNGAGKSTLLRLIATLGKPTAGKIHIRSIDALVEPERVRSEIGLISHQTLVYDDLTARENLTFYARMYGLTDLDERVESALSEVGLSERGRDRVRGYSRGMRQRLAIARAILHDPSILLLDEPFTGLDASAKAILSRMIEEAQRGGRTVVLVTHDLERGLGLCDGYAIMNRGRIVSRGSTDGLALGDLESLYERSTPAVPPSAF
jgi:heme exporter protein A